MKYGDLPPYPVMNKLAMVSFSSPKKSLDVYKFINSLNPLYNWIDMEVKKLSQLHKEEDRTNDGEEDSKRRLDQLDEIFSFPITDEIYVPDLSVDDFDSDNCHFSAERALWMNAADISMLFGFLRLLQSEYNK